MRSDEATLRVNVDVLLLKTTWIVSANTLVFRKDALSLKKKSVCAQVHACSVFKNKKDPLLAWGKGGTGVLCALPTSL
jgi:hypothetical protein